MKTNNNNEKITFSNALLHVIQGLFLGFANGIPFFNLHNLKEVMSIKEIPFRRPGTKNSENEDSSYEMTYPEELLYLLKHKSAMIIGTIIGLALFFFIPVDYLIENYPFAIYSSLLSMSVVFCLFEGLRIYRAKKERKHILISAITGVITFLCTFLILKFLSSSMSGVYEGEATKVLILAVLFLFGGFLYSFSGISLVTLIFVFSGYRSMASGFNTTLYEHTGFLTPILTLICAILGYLLGELLKRQDSFEMEKPSANVGLYLGVILYIAIDKMKAPYLTGVSTEIAEWITIGSAIFASLLISVVLSIHLLPTKKKDSIDEVLS
jgi:hypothetical protein